MLKKIVLSAVFFFCFFEYSQAKTITVGDGTDTDWDLTIDTDTIAVNSSLVSNNEWIWKDAENDERRNDTYDAGNIANASCDITEVRVTADATNLYFLIRFRNLGVGPIGSVAYPLIQIGIDYDKAVGESSLLNSAIAEELTEVNAGALWEFSVIAYDSDIVATPYTTGEGVTGSGTYSQYVSTTSAGFMEFSVPFDNIGVPLNYLGKTVSFSIVSLFRQRAWDVAAGLADVRPFETGSSYIIDCVSLIDAPELTQESDGSSHSGTAGTWEEVRDNIVDTYFDIKFDAVGNVVANSTPTITSPLFEVDNVQNNVEVVVEGRGPVFSWVWTFADADTGDTQKAAQIQIDVDTTTANGNEIWTCSPVLTATTVQYTGLEALQTGQTYYWRARVMDNHGAWSDWTDAGTFTTIKQAQPLNVTKNSLSIDWNNPFNPAKGDYTKIRYIIEKDKHVVIRIYGISGKLVKTVVDEDKLSNVVYTETWDGKNENGDIVSSGVYFVNIKAGSFTKTKKVVVIK